jgi:DNA-binding NarL/FixJ family response regulator
MITILIADDHHLIRHGIRALLEKQPHFKVICEAQNGKEALDMAFAHKPNIMILDINMPIFSGIEVAKRISESLLPIQMIILSMYSDESLVKRAFLNGAKGYLLKNSLAGDLIKAVETVNHQKVYVSPELESVVDWNSLLIESTEKNTEIMDKTLSAREREICQYVVHGYTNQAIANRLGISIKTVEKHRSNLMTKLGVHDITSLIQEALRSQIVFLDEKI